MTGSEVEMRTVGPVDGPKALALGFERATKEMKQPALAVVYLPYESDHAGYLSAIAKVLDVPVVGCTTGTAGFTERGFTTDGAVGALIGGEGLCVQTELATGVKAGQEAPLKAALEKLVASTRGKRFPHQMVMTLADSSACDGEVLVNCLRSTTPIHWSHIGGTAGDNFTFAGPKVFLGNKVYQDAVVFIALLSKSKPSFGVQHGFKPIQGAKEFTVTGIEGNSLKTLDGKPATQVYLSELERLGLYKDGDDIGTVMGMYEIGMDTVFGDEVKVRAPLYFGESEDGSMTLASGLPEGAIVRIVNASAEQLIAAAGQLVDDCLNTSALAGKSQGAFIFDCAARYMLLQARYPQQVAAFVQRGKYPVLGMTGYGEIARFKGRLEGFHNTTAVMASW